MRCGATTLMNSRDVITFVLFQNFGKCRTLPVTRVVGASRVGTLQKLVVAGILRDTERAHGADKLRVVLDELKKLLPEAPADF
jgi:hypothetical protein